jgi:hypothetical protein
MRAMGVMEAINHIFTSAKHITEHKKVGLTLGHGYVIQKILKFKSQLPRGMAKSLGGLGEALEPRSLPPSYGTQRNVEINMEPSRAKYLP